MATGEARPPGMVGKDICMMHAVNNSSGKLTKFTYTSRWNFLMYAAKRKKLNCSEAKIAVDLATRLIRMIPKRFCQHQHIVSSTGIITTYNRFCNKSKLEREQKRQLERVKSIVEGRK